MRFQTLRDVFWLLSDMAEDWAIASVWKMTDDLPQQPTRGIGVYQIQIVRFWTFSLERRAITHVERLCGHYIKMNLPL